MRLEKQMSETALELFTVCQNLKYMEEVLPQGKRTQELRDRKRRLENQFEEEQAKCAIQDSLQARQEVQFNALTLHSPYKRGNCRNYCGEAAMNV